MSDFWVRKMKTYFQRIDFDKDGAITQKDFEGMADRFVKREKLDESRGKELKTKLLQVRMPTCTPFHTHRHRFTFKRDNCRYQTPIPVWHCPLVSHFKYSHDIKPVLPPSDSLSADPYHHHHHFIRQKYKYITRKRNSTVDKTY